jgi:hypothetical protein
MMGHTTHPLVVIKGEIKQLANVVIVQYTLDVDNGDDLAKELTLFAF